MTRMYEAGQVAEQFDRLLQEAAERLPLAKVQSIKALRDLCRQSWDGDDANGVSAVREADRLGGEVLAAARSRLGGTGTRRSQRRKRASDEYDLLLDLRREVAKAPVVITSVIEHGDPVWYGPDDSWQTGDSMIRCAELNAVPDRLHELARSAEAFGWTEIAASVRALAGVARGARASAETYAFNERAVAIVTNVSGSLLDRLDGPHFASLDASARDPAPVAG